MFMFKFDNNITIIIFDAMLFNYVVGHDNLIKIYLVSHEEIFCIKI
jgi:hypothetical protein